MSIEPMHSSAFRDRTIRAVGPGRRWRLWFGVLWLAACVGCERDLETAYGQLRPPEGRASLHGFAAFGDALEQQGWRIRQASGVRDGDTGAELLIWAPMEQGLPSIPSMEWLETSFFTGGPRTLVFVYRCDDLTGLYWRTAQRLVPPEQRWSYRSMAAHADLELLRRRFDQHHPSEATHPWVQVTARSGAEQPLILSGAWAPEPTVPLALPAAISFKASTSPIAEDDSTSAVAAPVDEGAMDRATVEGLAPDASATIAPIDGVTEVQWVPIFHPLLIDDQGAVLAAELRFDRWGEGRVIVVAGASYLCNFGLTDPQRRAIASRLLDELSPPQPKALAYFLVTADTNLPIREFENAVLQDNTWRMLRVWPIGVVLLQLALLGLCAVLALWPILGRPRPSPAASEQDFGLHVSAMAALLQRNADPAFARQRIEAYRAMVRGEKRPVVRPLPSVQEPSDFRSDRPASAVFGPNDSRE